MSDFIKVFSRRAIGFHGPMLKSSSQLIKFPSARPLMKPLNVKAELDVAII